MPVAPPATPSRWQATERDGGSFDWPLAGLIAGGRVACAGAALSRARQTLRGHTRAAH